MESKLSLLFLNERTEFLENVTLLVFKFAQYLNSRRGVVREIKTERNIIRANSFRFFKLREFKSTCGMVREIKPKWSIFLAKRFQGTREEVRDQK